MVEIIRVSELCLFFGRGCVNVDLWVCFARGKSFEENQVFMM